MLATETSEQLEALEEARVYGRCLAEQILDKYGLQIGNERVDEAASTIMREVMQRVRERHQEGMPPSLAIDWGHECMNGLMDRILEHVGYLMLAAALVAFDPWKAVAQAAVRH